MKRNLKTKITCILLLISMLVGMFPITLLAASDASNNKSDPTEEDILSASDDLIKEYEAKRGVVKDRSEIPSAAQAAVYVDGKLDAYGDFSKMWNHAMEKAPSIKETDTDDHIKEMAVVEYVLNIDMDYDKSWFSEGTMTINAKKFTLDLNGHVIYRKDKSGSVIRVKGRSYFTIMDSNPDAIHGSYATDAMIKASGFVRVDVKGGAIAGGYKSTGDGGGLYIDGKSTVYMTGGTITGNKADIGSAIYIGGGSTLDMSGGNAQICYNHSAGTSADGGAIFVDSDCKVFGGNVHHNVADDYGGGVRAEGDNIIISGMAIHHNRSLEQGGGLFIERDNINQTITVTNCIITNNYADEYGGGVYICDPFLVKMENCVVQNNAANDEGGGIFLCDCNGTDLQIGGKMIVRYNYVASIGKMYSDYQSNLYLEGDDDLIVESLSTDSEVWLRIEEDMDDYLGKGNKLTAQPTNSSPYQFFSDISGYYVWRQDVPAEENYRHLYFEKGQRNVDLVHILTSYSPTLLSTTYTVRNGAYSGITQDVLKGYFRYSISSTDEYLPASPYYYTDGYFLEDPKIYNEQLATMSASLAFASIGLRSDDVEGNEYANHFASVKQILSDIGCAEESFYVNKDYQNVPEYYGDGERVSTIGVAISQKEIRVDDNSYVLLPVVIRGGDYGTEWGSNVSLGKAGEAKGFSDAARQVYDCITEYISAYDLTEKAEQGLIKFWVMGYSRAGATANLTSKRLVDSYAYLGNQIYGYTVEAAKGGIESAKEHNIYTDDGNYLSIHNIINENDIVPLVGPEEMGFIRYGTDHLIGSDYNAGNPVNYDPNSEYYKQRMLMVAQLKSINPYYCFNDYWEVADVNLILGNIPVIGTDLIDKGQQSWDNPNKQCKDIYSFIRWLVKMIQQDGLALEEDDDPRVVYSTKKFLSDIPGNEKTNYDYWDPRYNFAYSEYSLEMAICQVISLLNDSSDPNLSAALDRIMGKMSFLKDEELSIYSMYKIYSKAIDNWDEKTLSEKAEVINNLLHTLLNADDGTGSIWDLLDENDAEVIANSLPIVMWVLLEYASMDYNTSGGDDGDDGMWGVGTLINNLDVILSNHYPEVTLAWLRSYDSFYTNDLTAYKINNTHTQAPQVDCDSVPGKIRLKAEKGSSIFYSLDGGKSWLLYTTPISIGQTAEIKAFSSSYGAKSEVTVKSFASIDSPVIDENPFIDSAPDEHIYAASMLGDGNFIFIIFTVLITVMGITVTVFVKKKQTADVSEAEENDAEENSKDDKNINGE